MKLTGILRHGARRRAEFKRPRIFVIHGASSWAVPYRRPRPEAFVDIDVHPDDLANSRMSALLHWVRLGRRP